VMVTRRMRWNQRRACGTSTSWPRMSLRRASRWI
jgi:hypothetical protein